MVDNTSQDLIPSSAYSREIKIEIVSDTMWPNGFIGKRHLANAIEEINLTSRLQNPLIFKILRIPYLLETNYDESESWEEPHLDRMHRNFCDPQLYGDTGYNNCK